MYRHNEIRDFTANVLTEVCHDICVEPTLQELNGESLPHATANSDDGARLDICAHSFWGDWFRRAFFDVSFFYPNAPSYRNLQLSAVYRRHENEKKRNYEARVREVEHGSFTLLVFSTSGGMGMLAATVYKRLASQIAIKRDQPYSKVISWLRCHLCFSLLRSSATAIRGARSFAGRASIDLAAVDLAVWVGRIASH